MMWIKEFTAHVMENGFTVNKIDTSCGDSGRKFGVKQR